MFWSPKTPCVHPTRHDSGSHLMVPVICLTHQQSKVWCVVPCDSPSLDPPLPNRATEWEWSERPMFGVFLFRHNPVEILPNNRGLPDPPDLLRSKRNSEHPKIHTPSPLFLQIWEGLSKWRGSRRQDTTKRITAYCLSSEDRMRSLPLHISSRPSNFQCFGGQVQVQVWSCRSIYFNSAVCQLTCLPVSHWQVSRWITLGI